MPEFTVPRTPSAHNYQLLIKNILFCPVVDAPEQEIVYRGSFRYTYRGLRQRVNRDSSVEGRSAPLARAFAKPLKAPTHQHRMLRRRGRPLPGEVVTKDKVE